MIIDETYPASFNNFTFIFISDSTSYGKKIVAHEYPNSNKRFVEELGITPKIITFKGLVHGSIQRRLDFEAKLNDPGLHQLVHPFYGVIDNVMAGPFTIDTEISSMGAFYYDLTFYESSTDFVQTTTSIDEYTISEDNLYNIDGILDKLSSKYQVPTTITGFIAVSNKITDIFNTVREKMSLIVNPIKSAVANVNSIINSGLTNINNLVSDAEVLKNTFSSLYRSILNVVDEPNKLESFWKSLVDYERVLGVPLSASMSKYTNDRKKTADNITILDEHVRLVAMSSTYETSIYKDSKTTSEINETKAYLNALYDTNVNDSMENFDDDVILLVKDPEIRNLLTTTKSDAITILNNKLVNAWNVITERVGLTSITLLSYQYYEDIDDIDILINLNEDLNVSGFRQSVDVLGGK